MNRRSLSWIPQSRSSLSPCLSSRRHADSQAPKPPAEPIPAPADVAAAPADAETTASGLASKVLTPGTGTDHPIATDLVKVHYTGWTTDGKMFDSSVARGRPTVLPLNKVIAGWQEGLPLMVAGEKRRFWVPAKLAYEGKPDKPQGMLVFDVELIEILRVPPTPADVATPPTDAASHSPFGPCLEGPEARHRHAPPQGYQHRPGALHGLDDGRQDVRLLALAGHADHLPAHQGHPRLDRGAEAHDGRGIPPLLDS